MALADVLKTVAPAIASALGGPLAGAAVEFLAGKFGTEKTADAVAQTVSAMTADPVKMKQLDDEFQLEMAKVGIQLDLAQLGVNTEEAKSTNWFVAGWRPAVGWVCGFALFYVALAEPIGRFVAQVLYDYKGAFPVIDTTLTMQVLLGMLGLGAMRSVEKVKGGEDNR